MQQRGVERRARIVDAAIELFGQHGYRGTGVAAIATRVGVSPSAVIHHFGSKDLLLQAVLDEYDARAAARLSEYVGGGLPGLVAALHSDAEHMTRHAGLATLHTVLQAEHLATDSAVNTRFRERARLLRRHITATLAQAADDLPPGLDPGAAATELLAFLEGALTLWLLDPETVDLRALYRSYLGRLLGPGPAGP
ncbi:TetR/AcrR family transcriptional regulator [Kitasatospora sp. NPDC054939]